MPFFQHEDATIFYTIHHPTNKPNNEPSNNEQLTTSPKPQTHALLMHGLTCDSHDWSLQIPHLLSLNLTLIIPDLRGHGRSSAPLPSASYTIPALASDMSALLLHLRSPPALLIGHSMGGCVANHIAATSPELVAGLVLVDSMYGQPAAPPAAVEAFAQDPNAGAVALFEKIMYTAASPAWSRVWHARRALGTPSHAVMGCMSQMSRAGDEDCWVVGAERCRRFLEGRRARRLVVLGVFGGEKMREFEIGCGVDEGRGDRVVMMEGLGHWVHQDDPEGFDGVLEEWLRGNGYI